MDILMAIIYFDDLPFSQIKSYCSSKLQFFTSFDTKQLIKTKLMKMFHRISRLPLIELILSKSLKKFPFFDEPVENMAPD